MDIEQMKVEKTELGHIKEKLEELTDASFGSKKIKLGLFDGKYKMPSEDLLYGDDMSELFKDEEACVNCI